MPIPAFSFRTVFGALLCLLGASSLLAADTPMKQALWSGESPQSSGAITVHRPEKGMANGAAMVICPGGGYGGLVTGAEGHGIAKWLNKHGVTGIVLEYELPRGRSSIPLGDAQQAIRTARANAKAWEIDPDRIGVIGFSAGGHLASSVGVHHQAGDPKAKDPIARVSSRPDFLILVYPVISMGDITHGGSRKNLLGPNPSEESIKKFSSELQVTDQSPPAFLAHAVDDKVVLVKHSQLFHEALKKHGVATELLELPRGGHGLNGYKGPMWDAWQQQSLKWLAEQKFIPE